MHPKGMVNNTNVVKTSICLNNRAFLFFAFALISIPRIPSSPKRVSRRQVRFWQRVCTSCFQKDLTLAHRSRTHHKS